MAKSVWTPANSVIVEHLIPKPRALIQYVATAAWSLVAEILGYSLSQRCWSSGFCAGQSSWEKHFRFCAWRYCHVETGKGLPENVSTKLEANLSEI